MRIIIATDTGTLKVIRPESDQKVVSQWGQAQSRDLAVEHLCWQKEESGVLLVTKEGVVCSFDLDADEKLQKRWSRSGYAGTKGLYSFAAGDSPLHVVCSEAGLVSFLQENKDEAVSTFQTGSPVGKMRCSADELQLAIGGNERDLQIWNIKEQKLAWSAKNVGADFLDMRQKIYITDIQFSADAKRVYVGTGFGQLRVYDTKVQRKPVMNVKLGEHLITSIVASPDDNLLVAADTVGNLLAYDVRKGQLSGGYKGVGGSLRSVVHHPSLAMIASGGLDRFLRIHAMDSRKILHKIYVKQHINCVLFGRETEYKPATAPATVSETQELPESLPERDHPEGEKELDKMFSNLKQVGDVERKAKRKPSKSAEVVPRKRSTRATKKSES